MNRRQFLSTTSAALAASSLRAKTPMPKGQVDHVIMIWLGGGAAQIDTWDPKRKSDPLGKKPGCYYDQIPTVVPKVRVVEHLPQCAQVMDRMTILRSVNHGIVDEHAAASYHMHTGRMISGTVRYPSVGAVVAAESAPLAEAIPKYVVIGYPSPMRDPGFLGAKAGYLYLTDTEKGPQGFTRPRHLSDARYTRRKHLLNAQQKMRVGDRHFTVYDEAIAESLRLAGPAFMDTFDLRNESPELRTRYGDEFGQRCLMARRLCERGVRFVEVSHNLNFMNGTGWDTHKKGQLNQHLLIREMDRAIATLVQDLEKRKMLDRTLIVTNTEFGRPAGFDGQGGRGHHSKAFSLLMAGGGLNHCGAIGHTDEHAQKILDYPISVPDFHATIYAAMGIDPGKVLYDGDRPVPITDGGLPIAKLFG